MSVTLKHAVFKETVVKKSRFLAWVEPVASGGEAKNRIEEIRKQYQDARHVCFAFYVEGSSGMADDGEPSGTAGKPMFSVLNHKRLVNVLAVVVRYFGGIKLGAGGLTRAYGGSVSAALEDAVYEKVERKFRLQLQFTFALESQVRRICQNYSLDLEDVRYQTEVSASVIVKSSQLDVINEALTAIAPGSPDFVVQLED